MSDEMRPPPLVAADVDLRDFPFMPLDVRRLRDSDLASDETPEACWAALLLWSASWHQVPASSIPNSEQWMAKQAGYLAQGRILPAWKRVRKGALRGWVECSDGRLYHPVVAEKAREAWKSKQEQRWRTECARIKKHNQRHGANLPTPEFETWLSLGCPQGQVLPVPGDSDGRPQNVSGEKASKGQGQGQGQGQGESGARGPAHAPTHVPTPAPGPASAHAPTRAGEACLAMRRAGLADCNPGHPRLLALLEAGMSPDELAAAAADAVKSGKGFAWVLGTAEGRRRDAANIRSLPAREMASKPWEGAR